MTAIVDYKAGNLTSVKNAFEALGVETVVTADPKVVADSERVVFPGVGAAKSAMENLRNLGLVDAVKTAATDGRPFLGICLGMQILFEHSEEDGGVDTLGVIRGKVKRFPDVPGFKVPEIGWNNVERIENLELRIKNGGIGQSCASLSSEATNHESRATNHETEYYFVHSYYAEVVPETALVTEYAGVKFTAMVKKGSLWACQFHPEKSGRIGLKLIERWMAC